MKQLLGLCLVCGGSRCYKNNIYLFECRCGLVRGKGVEVGLINGNSWYAFSKHIPCLVSGFLLLALKQSSHIC